MAGVAVTSAARLAQRDDRDGGNQEPAHHRTVKISSTSGWKCSGAPAPGSSTLKLALQPTPCSFPASTKLR